MTNRHVFECSSSMVECGHTDDTLEITFSSGHTYRYPNCPQTVFDELKAAASPGNHFHKNIKPHYKGMKV